MRVCLSEVTLSDGRVINIELRWGVKLKSTRIYEILNELNLSYQKAHRDYANAEKEQQKLFIWKLKKTQI